MNNLIKNLEIKNFKSIKHLQLDCKRVNVIIGRPNVGKSNILEAISLLGGTYSTNTESLFSEFIRYSTINELFYDKKYLNPIEVSTDKLCAFIRYHNNSIGTYDYMLGGNWVKDFLDLEGDYTFQKIEQKFNALVGVNEFEKDFTLYANPEYLKFDKSGHLRSDREVNNFSIVKKYDFKSLKDYNAPFSIYLTPPNGDNLFTILYQEEELQDEINRALEFYGLSLMYVDEDKKFVVGKNKNRNLTVFSYNNMADTFQRLFFYLAAIESNKNSVLILEEPEVHSFPPYVKTLAERIVDDVDNQYFIATHSPYLLQTILRKLDSSEVNIIVAYYENHETKIKVLNPEELNEVQDFGIDLFFNIETFEGNADKIHS